MSAVSAAENGLPACWRPEAQPVAAAARRRHHVRQWRQQRCVARRTGVLPPGDVLKCALALARNEAEARRVLLSRLPMLEHARLSAHRRQLLLSMMEQYSGDFLAAVDGLRRLLGCSGHVLAGQHRAGDAVRRLHRRDLRARRAGVDAGQRDGKSSSACGSSRTRRSIRPPRRRSWGSTPSSSVRAASTPA